MISRTESDGLAVVQGIVVDSTGNITAHSDSRKGGNPQAYILKS